MDKEQKKALVEKESVDTHGIDMYTVSHQSQTDIPAIDSVSFKTDGNNYLNIGVGNTGMTQSIVGQNIVGHMSGANVFTYGGNVGSVGTTSPSKKLHVTGQYKYGYGSDSAIKETTEERINKLISLMEHLDIQVIDLKKEVRLLVDEMRQEKHEKRTLKTK